MDKVNNERWISGEKKLVHNTEGAVVCGLSFVVGVKVQPWIGEPQECTSKDEDARVQCWAFALYRSHKWVSILSFCPINLCHRLIPCKKERAKPVWIQMGGEEGVALLEDDCDSGRKVKIVENNCESHFMLFWVKYRSVYWLNSKLHY